MEVLQSFRRRRVSQKPTNRSQDGRQAILCNGLPKESRTKIEVGDSFALKDLDKLAPLVPTSGLDDKTDFVQFSVRAVSFPPCPANGSDISLLSKNDRLVLLGWVPARLALFYEKESNRSFVESIDQAVSKLPPIRFEVKMSETEDAQSFRHFSFNRDLVSLEQLELLLYTSSSHVHLPLPCKVYREDTDQSLPVRYAKPLPGEFSLVRIYESRLMKTANLDSFTMTYIPEESPVVFQLGSPLSDELRDRATRMNASVPGSQIGQLESLTHFAERLSVYSVANEQTNPEKQGTHPRSVKVQAPECDYSEPYVKRTKDRNSKTGNRAHPSTGVASHDHEDPLFAKPDTQRMRLWRSSSAPEQGSSRQLTPLLETDEEEASSFAPPEIPDRPRRRRLCKSVSLAGETPPLPPRTYLKLGTREGTGLQRKVSSELTDSNGPTPPCPSRDEDDTCACASVSLASGSVSPQIKQMQQIIARLSLLVNDMASRGES